jgi:hypothetical protein
MHGCYLSVSCHVKHGTPRPRIHGGVVREGAARPVAIVQVERRIRLAGRDLDAEDPGERLGLLQGLQVLGGVDAEEILQAGRGSARDPRDG